MTKPLAGSSAMETRYFIGLTSEGWRLSLTAGPGTFNGPVAPFLMGDTEMFPVSQAVLREWSADEDDEELDPAEGDPRDECVCGDYREHHHDLGCTICIAGTPPPDGADGCRRFRLAFRAGEREKGGPRP